MMPYRIGVVELFFVLLVCLVPLVIAAIVAVAVVWLSKRQAPAGTQGSSTSALEVLKTRYAKGEITREQFDAMRKDLE